MLNMYLNATGGMVRWLLFIILEFVGPVIRIVGLFMSIGGLFVFIYCLVTHVSDSYPWGQKVTYIGLGMGLVGSAILTMYQIAESRLFMELLYGNEEDDEESSVWLKLRNGLALLALYAGVSVASYHYYHLVNGVEAMAVGFCWFQGVGMVLGACRWLYNLSDDTIFAIKEATWAKMRKARRVVVPKQAEVQAKAQITEEEIKAAAKAFVDDNKVVPIRRLG